MEKLKLDLETLDVESFTASGDDATDPGTVQAYSAYVTNEFYTCTHRDPSRYCAPTEFEWPSCGVSCWYECLNTLTNPTCEGC